MNMIKIRLSIQIISGKKIQRWREVSFTICCFVRLSDCKFIGKSWQIMPPRPSPPSTIIPRALGIYYFSPSHSLHYSRITIYILFVFKFLHIGCQHKQQQLNFCTRKVSWLKHTPSPHKHTHTHTIANFHSQICPAFLEIWKRIA